MPGHLRSRARGKAEAVTIPDATHFVHLDRAERGRDAFLSAVRSFLTARES